MQDQHNLKPGTILQNYEIIRVLGAGGFGITYLARDRKSNIDVVIKEYFPNAFAIRNMGSGIIAKTDSENDFNRGLQRFKEEAKTLIQFNHATIVKILEYFEANNTAYFVMKDEGGVDLDKYLQQYRPPLSQDKILGIVIPILEGLKEVHAYNYLHRDIKPGNILLRDNQMPVLIDFGASKLALGEVSKSITAILTPGYAPPEQYSTDVKKQGPFTDLYSLAAVMYKMITGTVPPDAQTRIYALLSDKNDPYVSLVNQDFPNYDIHFLRAIDNALNVDAEKRPQTVQVFQAAILGEIKTPSSQPTQVIQIENNISEPSSIFSFEGRMNRLKYFLYSFLPILIVLIGTVPLLIATKEGSTSNPIFSMIMFVLVIIAVWISLAIQVKRWHDLDQSGWWVLLGFVPYVNVVVIIILWFVKGTVGSNRFGSDPLAYVQQEQYEVAEDYVDQDDEGEQVNIPPERVGEYSNNPSVTLLGIGNKIPPIILTSNKEVIIGRSSTSDIKIENKYVSGKHVALTLDDNLRVQVRDLSSSNGTYIGGQKLEANVLYELGEGERLLIASEDVVYTL